MKISYKDSNIGRFIDRDVQYLQTLHDLHKDLPFLCERIKIEKVGNLLANLHEKKEYVIHIIVTKMSKMSKKVMYEFWYDYVKPKQGEKTKLCYMDTENFIVYIETEHICVDIAKGVETRCDPFKL